MLPHSRDEDEWREGVITGMEHNRWTDGDEYKGKMDG